MPSQGPETFQLVGTVLQRPSDTTQQPANTSSNGDGQGGSSSPPGGSHPSCPVAQRAPSRSSGSPAVSTAGTQSAGRNQSSAQTDSGPRRSNGGLSLSGFNALGWSLSASELLGNSAVHRDFVREVGADARRCCKSTCLRIEAGRILHFFTTRPGFR